MARNVFRRTAPIEPGPRRGRILILSVFLALAFVGLIVRAWDLQVLRHDHFQKRSAGQHETTITLRASRGAIYDRNGRELALTAMVPSIYAVPRVLQDPGAASAALAGLLDLDVQGLRERLSTDKAFTWLRRHVSPAVAKQVMALNLAGIDQRDEPRRFYPNRSLAGPLIGFAGVDGVGLEGIERDFDRYLAGKEYTLEAVRDAAGRKAMPGGALPPEHLTGYDVTLTIDSRIQQLAEAALTAQVKAMRARSGLVVVMDPHTGDILAMAQTPAFDPNLFREAEPDDWRNRILTDTLEPGSTIKPLLIAAALDMGKVRADSVWNGYHGRIKVGRKTITDVHGVDQLTTLEIIQRSSNVGAVQVAQRIGKDAYYSYLRAYGFGEPTGIGLQGEVEGNLRPAKQWGLIHLATFSYGYGFSVTPLQMTRAMAAIANGGMLVRPRLVLHVKDARGRIIEEFPDRHVRRVLQPQATKEVTEGLIMVTHKGGTGRKASVPGYEVAGKTGTAHKVDPLLRGYSKDKVKSSFVGFVPARDPRLVIYVNIDEPREAQYGGVVAAPVFSEIAREALPYMGIEATEEVTSEEGDDEPEEESAEGLDPQARPWWFEEAVLAGAPSHLVVPDLRGASLAEVVQRTAELSLRVEVEGAGFVVSQQPKPGALLPENAAIAVTLALPGQVAAGGER
ncbi:MAG: penicillin-binding protein [bacterium]